MAIKVYDNKQLLYGLYITKKMTIDDIAKYMERMYNVKVTSMTIWNMLKKHDLLKAAGKGRTLGKRTNPQKKTPTTPGKTTPNKPKNGGGSIFF